MSNLKPWTALLALVLASPAFAGVNLIKDSDVGSNPLSDEFRLYGSDTGRLSSFEEEFTWNRCAKLEITSFNTDANGKRGLKTGVLIGGSAKTPGFAVAGNGKYRFSFELKGTAARLVPLLKVYDGDGRERQLELEIKEIFPQGEWTQYRGSFKVPGDAVRAALYLELFFHENYGRMPYKVGDWVLVDKVSVESNDGGREIRPTRVAVIGSGKTAALDGFRLYGLVDSPAEPLTSGSVRCGRDGLEFLLTMRGLKTDKLYSGLGDGGEAFWLDDHVELFFAAPGKEGASRHFGVSAGGGRWMDGKADYAAWSASVTRQGDVWTAKVAIPWTFVGYGRRPVAGEPVMFNFTRERVLGDERDPKTPKGNYRGAYHWFEDSSWTYVREDYNDKRYWGRLFVDSMKPYVERRIAALTEPEVRAKASALPTDDPTADYRLLERLTEENSMARLSKEPFVVAQVPFSTEPSVPYLPDELTDPQPVFKVRAAVNERTALPLAVANMTEAMEEYRVTLRGEWGRLSGADESLRPVGGFRSADGASIGAERLCFRRGVRFRDADAKGHGARYDVLATMNAASTLPVASKEAGLVWIEIDLRDAKPGLYRSTLVVTPLAGGGLRGRTRRDDGYAIDDGSKEIPVELEVLPFAFDDEMKLALCGTEHPITGYAVDFHNRYDAVGHFVTPWFFGATFNADGSLKERKPSPHLGPRLDIIREHARRIRNLPRADVADDAYGIFLKVHAGMRNPHLKPGTPEFWRAYREWVVYIDETMKAHGLPDYVLEVFDEPSLEKWKTGEIIDKVLKETRAAVPGVSIAICSGQNSFYDVAKDQVDFWTWYSGYEWTLKWIPEWAAGRAGRVPSVYSCGTSMRQELHRYYRLLPWKAFATGCDLVMIFLTTDQAPGMDFRRVSDGGLTYDTGSELLPSIRLESFYRGMQDVNYLRYLKSIATGDGAAAKAARQFLVDGPKEAIYVAPHDPAVAESVRSRAIDHILAVMKENARK